MFASLEGWRHVNLRTRSGNTDRHAAVDYAHVLKDLSGIHFKHARTIVLVQDNSPRAGGVRRALLNIHAKALLHEAFPAAEARRLAGRFEWPYTPKHGGRLDLVGSEPGVLLSQCLGRRIPAKQTLINEIAAWEHGRNASHTKANLPFTTPNASIKLKHPYPQSNGIRPLP